MRDMGWNVLTVWECQLKPAARARTLAAIEYYINHSYLMKQGDAGRISAYVEPDDTPMPVAAEAPTEYGG